MNYSPSNGNYQDSDCYGPFPSFNEAFSYMSKHLPNPGAWSKDITGRKNPPKRAPNGSPVKHVMAPRKRKAAITVDQKFSVGDMVTVQMRVVDRDTGRKVWMDVKKKIINVFPPTFSGSDWQYMVQDINVPDIVSTVTQDVLLAQNEPTMNKTASLEKAWGRPIYGAFRVRVPVVQADIDMQVRSLRKPQAPTKVPTVIVEGILRFKLGGGERVAVIVQFDVIRDAMGDIISNVTARGLAGVQVSYVLEPIIRPLLPLIAAQAVREGLLQ